MDFRPLRLYKLVFRFHPFAAVLLQVLKLASRQRRARYVSNSPSLFLGHDVMTDDR